MKQLFVWIDKQNITQPKALYAELLLAHGHYLLLNKRVVEQDRKISTWVKHNEACQRVKAIPGVGGMVASQLIMEVGNARQFKNGREMAA